MPHNKKVTCCATDLMSSRGASMAMCPFNAGKAKGSASDNLLICHNCGMRVCRGCVVRLRTKAKNEVERLKHLKLVASSALTWLLEDYKPATNLFDPDYSCGVLFYDNCGRLCFRHECIFCFNFALPTRTPLEQRLPKTVRWIDRQPFGGTRRVYFLEVCIQYLCMHVAHAHACRMLCCVVL